MTAATILAVESLLAENMPASEETLRKLPTGVYAQFCLRQATELAVRCLANDYIRCGRERKHHPRKVAETA